MNVKIKVKPTKLAAIMLYGNRATGAGYIATMPGWKTMFGDAEPKNNRDFTVALWLALADLQNAGYTGAVTVHVDRGTPRRGFVAKIKRVTDRPWFGSLEFAPAEAAAIITIEGGAR